MHFYENEYWVLRPNYEKDHFNEPVSDAITGKQFIFEIRLPLFARPFIFSESTEREDLPPDPPHQVIFVSGSVYPLIKNKVREALLDVGIPETIALNPSVFIDYRKKWHEDYWLISVTEKMDYWDPNLSVYDKDLYVGPEEDKLYLSINKVRLNSSLLDTIPVIDRRIFLLKTIVSGLIIHESIKQLFEVPETKLIPFAEFFNSFD